jgi:hypothetical protein
MKTTAPRSYRIRRRNTALKALGLFIAATFITIVLGAKLLSELGMLRGQ